MGPHSGAELDEAHRVQLDRLATRERAGARVGGWKVAFTSGASRGLIEGGLRPFGYVLADRILASSSVIALDTVKQCRLEPELCLVLGAELGGAATDAAAARAAVSGVAPAFEILEVRTHVDQTPLSERVADGINNWGIVVGPPIAPPAGDIRATTVTTRVDGRTVGVYATDADTMDDPYESLARLCHRLSHFGRRLHPGEHVITGAFAVHDVLAGQQWAAEFAGIGAVEVQFVDAADSAGEVGAGG